jgi:hypothetical protein
MSGGTVALNRANLNGEARDHSLLIMKRHPSRLRREFPHSNRLISCLTTIYEHFGRGDLDSGPTEAEQVSGRLTVSYGSEVSSG